MEKSEKIEDEYPRAGYEYQLSLKPMLEYAAFNFPREEIVYRDISRYNYAKYYERVQRLANVLDKLGIDKGDMVGIMDWNTHRFLEAYFGVPCRGSVMHMINPALPPEQVAYTINHAEDKVLLLNADFLPLIHALKGSLKTVKNYVIMTDKGEMPENSLEPVHDYESLMDEASPEYEFPDLNENTIATMFYTTGTTGWPKGVFFSHRALTIHTMVWSGQIIQHYKPPGNMVVSHLVPMFHVHSWGIPFSGVYMGIKQVLPGRLTPEVFLELVKNEGVNFACSVPSFLRMVCYHPDIEEYRPYLRGLHYVVGGSALPKALSMRAEELGMQAIGAWGMSETSPIIGASFFKPHMKDWPDDKKMDFQIKAGWPGPYVDQRVVDVGGRDVLRDGKQMGEVILRAPWLTMGYYRDPERSMELWRDGWLHTGDIANIDDEGNIRIVDRDKDVVKSGGEWISTIILEDLITMDDSVQEVAVIGAPHPEWEERPIALVVPKTGMEASEEKLRDNLNQFVSQGKILKWWIPDRFFVVDSIPKTSVGKINKKALKPEYKDLFTALSENP